MLSVPVNGMVLLSLYTYIQRQSALILYADTCQPFNPSMTLHTHFSTTTCMLIRLLYVTFDVAFSKFWMRNQKYQLPADCGHLYQIPRETYVSPMSALVIPRGQM